MNAEETNVWRSAFDEAGRQMRGRPDANYPTRNQVSIEALCRRVVELSSAKTERDDAVEVARKLHSALLDSQWSDYCGEDSDMECAYCCGTEQSGHQEGCSCAEALKDAEDIL